MGTKATNDSAFQNDVLVRNEYRASYTVLLNLLNGQNGYNNFIKIIYFEIPLKWNVNISISICSLGGYLMCLWEN